MSKPRTPVIHPHGTPGVQPTAQFPGKVWDGSTPSGRVTGDLKNPDFNDYNQVVDEVQAVQSYVIPSAWAALTLTGGWTPAASQGVPSYRTVGGRVYLRGVMAPGTKTDGTTIFTLPTALRPTNKQTFRLCSSGPDTDDTGAKILIGTDGTGKLYGVVNAISLDLRSVEFFVDQ